jgi:hypothetical protein
LAEVGTMLYARASFSIVRQSENRPSSLAFLNRPFPDRKSSILFLSLLNRSHLTDIQSDPRENIIGHNFIQRRPKRAPFAFGTPIKWVPHSSPILA